MPKIGPGEVLMQVESALTCGTDAKVYLRGGHPRMIKPPAVFGHEMAGVVAAVGPGVEDTFRLGMRVVAANSAPCNRCFYCKIDRQSMCRDLLFINGAYGQYVKIPKRIVEQNLLFIPEGISFAEAALTEPLACAVHGIEESGIRLGDTLVVNGAGPIGLMFVRLAKLKGAKVIACDMQKQRLKTASKLGADITIDINEIEDQVSAVRKLTEDGQGVDIAIEAVGSPEVWEKTLAMVRKGGIVNLFGGCAPGTKIELDTQLLHYSELTIKAVFHHTPYYIRVALDLLARRAVDARTFITAERPLDKISEALEMIVNHQGIKTAVFPQIKS
jgi:L-iditol 2-dehydrogenase